MPRVTVHIGGREQLLATILKATPLGALGTDALVYFGPVCLQGTANAMRALADVLVEAADMAEEYDRDPAAWAEREQAERDANR
jgi:hypothetical protein